MKALLTSVAAAALVVGFAADGFANPKVKFSTDSDASVDNNSILSNNAGGRGAGAGGDGARAGVNVGGSVNFESFNTDIEVITNKELGVTVADISFVLNAAPGGPGSTGTINVSCTDDAQCDISVVSDVSGTPQGGAGGVAQFTTGGVSMSGTCRGFCNWVGNTGFANAIVAETASSIFAKVGSRIGEGTPNSTP